MRETHNCLKDLQNSEISEFMISLLPADAWGDHWQSTCSHPQRPLAAYSDHSLLLLAPTQKPGDAVGSEDQGILLPLLIGWCHLPCVLRHRKMYCVVMAFRAHLSLEDVLARAKIKQHG